MLLHVFLTKYYEMVNMSCEICGGEIHGRKYKIKVEGTVMIVCSDCADLGERVYEPRRSRGYVHKGKSSRSAGRKSSSHPRKTPSHRPAPKKKVRNPASYDLVNDYSRIVRKARGKMTQEDFAGLLNEKETLIHKIETGKMKPTIQLARKIEKKFHVKLLVRSEDAGDEGDRSWVKDKKDSYVPSLGDFIKEK